MSPATSLVRLDLDDPRWLDLVARRGTLPFHDPAWARLLEEAYAYPAFALGLCDSAAAEAGLPVLEVRSRMGGARWVSLPFTDVCPPLTADADDGRLAAELTAAARAAGVGRVEIRGSLPGEGVHPSTVGFVHVLSLAGGPERTFARFHKSHVQRAIKKAEREGVAVTRAAAAADLTGTFYRLHVGTRRRLGAPVQPRRFFELLWSRLLAREKGFLLLAHVSGRPVAGAVFLTAARGLVYKYGASDERFLRYRPNHLVFWTAIRWACEHGLDFVHFGRTSPGQTGLREFKRRFGADEVPLVYSSIGRAVEPRTETPGAVAFLLRRSPTWAFRAVGELLYRYAA